MKVLILSICMIATLAVSPSILTPETHHTAAPGHETVLPDVIVGRAKARPPAEAAGATAPTVPTGRNAAIKRVHDNTRSVTI